MTRQTDNRTNGRGTDLVRALSDRIGNRAQATTVFADAVTHGEVTVIPVARSVFGFGGGSGPGQDGAPSNEGGGGGAVVRPIGYIELTTRGARFRPIRDPRGQIVLAAIAVGILLRAVRQGATCRACSDRTTRGGFPVVAREPETVGPSRDEASVTHRPSVPQ